jgi:hypothetical protein
MLGVCFKGSWLRPRCELLGRERDYACAEAWHFALNFTVAREAPPFSYQGK